MLGGNDVIPAKHVVKRIKKCEKKGYDGIIVNINSPGGTPFPAMTSGRH